MKGRFEFSFITTQKTYNQENLSFLYFINYFDDILTTVEALEEQLKHDMLTLKLTLKTPERVV